jgi:hypothetical protein
MRAATDAGSALAPAAAPVRATAAAGADEEGGDAAEPLEPWQAAVKVRSSRTPVADAARLLLLGTGPFDELSALPCQRSVT